MKLHRKDVFRMVRQHIGPEICPTVSRAQRAGRALADNVDRTRLREAVDCLSGLSTASETADRLRQTLVTYIILAHSDPPPPDCPNCRHPLPRHNDKCLYFRLERAIQELIEET